MESPAAPQDTAHPGLSVYGEIYPNACTPAEMKKLQDMLAMGKAQEAQQLERTIEVILCAPDDESNRPFIRKLVPVKVRQTVESTGDKPTTKMVLHSEDLITNLMATGNAWSATVRVEGTEVTLDYWANEACVKGVTFSFSHSKWNVSELSEACD
jgi:hypothetical protein